MFFEYILRHDIFRVSCKDTNFGFSTDDRTLLYFKMIYLFIIFMLESVDKYKFERVQFSTC